MMLVLLVLYVFTLFTIKITKKSPKIQESLKKVLVLDFAEIFKKV